MLFSSAEFIFFFLPLVLLGYYAVRHLWGVGAAKYFLVAASLFFYGWWKPAYLPLLLGSIGFNYLIGRYLMKTAAGAESAPPARARPRRVFLIAGITGNLALLGYYKYAVFATEIVASLTGLELALEALLLPLAISFFTFQQIAFLVDAYRGEVDDFQFGSYALFVSFFPQLIAGPIVHHREMMPQFKDRGQKWPGWQNVSEGLQIFILGLAKKLIIADTLALYADRGWGQADSLLFFDAWATTLCYTFQLYFDFSGYSDMAIGAARLFGIKLPLNFNSPYKALDIREFWKRWHMTLSRWLRDYLYVPLGGNRRGPFTTYRNLFITFLLGGIWHGAGWTFVVWGILHGVGCIAHRGWQRLGGRCPPPLAWLLTFLYVHLGWVFFRAGSIGEAWHVCRSLVGLNGAPLSADAARLVNYLVGHPITTPGGLAWNGQLPFHVVLFLLPAALIAFLGKNSAESALGAELRHPILRSFWLAALCVLCALTTIRAVESPFLYFNF